MAIAYPNSQATADLVRAIGLDPARTLSLTISFEPNELAKVKATLVLTDEQTREMFRVAKQYNLRVDNGEQVL